MSKYQQYTVWQVISVVLVVVFFGITFMFVEECYRYFFFLISTYIAIMCAGLAWILATKKQDITYNLSHAEKCLKNKETPGRDHWSKEWKKYFEERVKKYSELKYGIKQQKHNSQQKWRTGWI